MTKKSFSLALLAYLEGVVLFTAAYNFNCPPRSQRKQRALDKCEERTYHCLFDVNNKTFVEICGLRPFPMERGVKAVLSKHLNTEKCPKHLYMPYIINTDESHDCMFLKSSCNEKGQIKCSNRSDKKDTVCTCNFLDGYAFVQTPKHMNYCIPSEEDCSCFKRHCEKNEILSQDYQCIPKDETCSWQNLHSQDISFHKEKYKQLSTETNYKQPCTETCMTQLQKQEYAGCKDILECGIPVLISIVTTSIFCFILLECQKHSERGEDDKHNIETTNKVKSEMRIVSSKGQEKGEQHTEKEDDDKHNIETTDKVKSEMKIDSSKGQDKEPENDRFSFHCKGAKIQIFLHRENLQKEGFNNKPRILDMVFMKDRKKLSLVWIDADNKTIVKYNIQENSFFKGDSLDDEPNRLAKINETKIAVIYKRKLDIMIYNVVDMKEENTYYIEKVETEQLSKSRIQGILALNEHDLILSDKTKLYECNLNMCRKNKLEPVRFGSAEFDTARRLTHVTIEDRKEIIFIADENDKQLTSLKVEGNKTRQLESHSRGLQNVRAIVATNERVYAATSAGVSVYKHVDGRFGKFKDCNEYYKMLLEYEKHVEHTRSLCLVQANERFYLGISGVIKQEDFVLLVTFEKDEMFC